MSKTATDVRIEPTTSCVGRCGATVHASDFGCTDCWDLLPVELQRDIEETWARRNVTDHYKATMRARAWFVTVTGTRFTPGDGTVPDA